jgi:ferrous iron transport protein A
MYLIDLEKNQKALIVKVNASKPLKERFNAFGLIKGEELSIKGCSLGKQTIEVEVGGATLIALRADEAEKIEVEPLTS